MSECYDAKLDEERHRHIKEKLEEHDNTLDEHDSRLKMLEGKGERVDEKIENLCDQIKSLVSTLKWGMGLLGASFLGLFIYLLELHLK
ncbi:hemolysin XhlA family protein [Clostridium tyrobutyricum]|uniref:hemolysin XhlA family protein n=1 Tax=Clostridium tyrobutyricum TaxID=1519 RepID=UPI001C38C53F|nr:hemolysin XhlA family protein [Clostridium tyrobutyricum]MBV4441732.1 hemolysin XhlA family protein [Clostridium tyrobutyricum]